MGFGSWVGMEKLVSTDIYWDLVRMKQIGADRSNVIAMNFFISFVVRISLTRASESDGKVFYSSVS